MKIHKWTKVNKKLLVHIEKFNWRQLGKKCLQEEEESNHLLAFPAKRGQKRIDTSPAASFIGMTFGVPCFAAYSRSTSTAVTAMTLFRGKMTVSLTVSGEIREGSLGSRIWWACSSVISSLEEKTRNRPSNWVLSVVSTCGSNRKKVHQMSQL